MKRLILLSLIVTAAAHTAVAQIPEQPLEYEKVSDDPDNAVSKLYLGVEPLFFDINGTNGIAMGWGFYSHYHIKQKLMFSARFQTPYFRGFVDGAYMQANRIGDKPPEGEEKELFNDYRPGQLFYMDLNASTMLMRFQREDRPVKIWLSTGGTDINNYIDGTTATKRYQLMLRAGLLMRNSTVLLKTMPDDASFTGGPGDAFTKMKSVSLYAGLSFNKMWDLVANITELNIGRKIARMHKAYYFDAMFAPVMSFKDLEHGSSTLDLTSGSVDDGYLGTSRLGARIGVANMPEYKNNLTGWEIGIFPSWTSRNSNFTGGYFKWWWILDVYSSED